MDDEKINEYPIFAISSVNSTNNQSNPTSAILCLPVFLTKVAFIQLFSKNILIFSVLFMRTNHWPFIKKGNNIDGFIFFDEFGYVTPYISMASLPRYLMIFIISADKPVIFSLILFLTT